MGKTIRAMTADEIYDALSENTCQSPEGYQRDITAQAKRKRIVETLKRMDKGEK